MSFSRNAGSYCSNPKLRSQAAISIARASGLSGSRSGGRCIQGRRSNGFIAQLVEQRFGTLQIGGVEALGEPAVDRGEKIARLGGLALVAPQPGEAGGGAQLPRLRILRTGSLDRP